PARRSLPSPARAPCPRRGTLGGGSLGGGTLAPAPLRARAVIAAIGEKFESQRARERRRLDQAHGDAVSQPVRQAAALADEGMAILVVAKIFAADGARGNEAVRAGVVELDEQTGAGGAGNVSLEGCADAVGEEMREQAVEGFALGFHGAALGGRDLRADLAHRRRALLLRQRAIAELPGADEAAVNHRRALPA